MSKVGLVRPTIHEALFAPVEAFAKSKTHSAPQQFVANGVSVIIPTDFPSAREPASVIVNFCPEKVNLSDLSKTPASSRGISGIEVVKIPNLSVKLGPFCEALILYPPKSLLMREVFTLKFPFTAGGLHEKLSSFSNCLANSSRL